MNSDILTLPSKISYLAKSVYLHFFGGRHALLAKHSINLPISYSLFNGEKIGSYALAQEPLYYLLIPLN